MNGKFRVSGITEDIAEFAFLKQAQDQQFSNGIYLFMGAPRRICLMYTDSELRDFFFANGGLNSKRLRCYPTIPMTKWMAMERHS